MVMSKRKHIFIPCINSLNLLPNLADLDLNSESTDPITTETREQYAMIILLLFYPFRTQDDLMLNGSYWVKYEHVLSQNRITLVSLQFKAIKLTRITNKHGPTAFLL